MTALLQFFGILPSEKKRDPAADQAHHDITLDQIAYAHELADERRRAWASAKTHG